MSGLERLEEGLEELHHLAAGVSLGQPSLEVAPLDVADDGEGSLRVDRVLDHLGEPLGPRSELRERASACGKALERGLSGGRPEPNDADRAAGRRARAPRATRRALELEPNFGREAIFQRCGHRAPIVGYDPMTRYPFGPPKRIGPLLVLGLTLLGALASLAMVPSTAAAQTEEELERARAQFMEALDAMDTSPPNYEAATELFRQVLEVRATPQVRLNLATCLVELFQFNDADEQIQEILEDEETDDAVRGAAAQLHARIERDGGRIEIELGGDVPRRLRILLNDREVSSRLASRPLRVAPGPHRVSIESGGEELAFRDVNVPAQGREAIHFVVAEGAGSAVVAVDQVSDDEALPQTATPATVPDDALTGDTADEDEEASTPLVSDWRFWAVFSAGIVVLAGAGVATGIVLGAESDPINIDPFQGDFSPALLTF